MVSLVSSGWSRVVCGVVTAFALGLSSVPATFGAPPPVTVYGPESAIRPPDPPRTCPPYLEVSGRNCVCPSGRDNGTCCVPTNCPSGQVATCSGCGCPSGQIPAGTAGGNYNIVGASASTCVPSTCPRPGIINCVAAPGGGQNCSCTTCPTNSTFNPATGQCVNQCVIDEVWQITVQQTNDRAGLQNQSVWTNAVPSCLDRRIGEICLHYRGRIQSEEYTGPPHCRKSIVVPVANGFDVTLAQFNAAVAHKDALYTAAWNAWANATHLNNVLSQHIAVLNNTHGFWRPAVQAATDAARRNWQNAENQRIATDGAYNAYRYGEYARLNARLQECNPWIDRAEYLSDDCGAELLKWEFALGRTASPFNNYKDRPYFMYSSGDGKYNVMQFTVDKYCNRVSAAEACKVNQATYRNTWTPISLEWNDNKVLDNLSFTQFPVDPKEKNKWFTWRGSEETPLLVFDPKRTKAITSAEQLFGSFSFGKSWDNGFAALKSLDKNGDRRVSGDELSGLALWFDSGADGVASPGEIRTLEEAKVTALFYHDVETLKSGDLRIAAGFERSVNGTKEFGAAVDWKSTTFSTLEEAITFTQKNATATSKGISKLLRDAEQKPLESTGDQDKGAPFSKVAINEGAPPPVKVEPVSAVKGTTQRPVTGYWAWKATRLSGAKVDPKNAKGLPSGVLAFVDLGSNQLRGKSVIEVPVNGDLTQLMTLPLEGTITAGDNNTSVLEFEVKSPEGGNTKTVARMNDAGTELRGQSVLDLGPGSNGKPMTLHYNWVAVRKTFSYGKDQNSPENNAANSAVRKVG